MLDTLLKLLEGVPKIALVPKSFKNIEGYPFSLQQITSCVIKNPDDGTCRFIFSIVSKYKNMKFDHSFKHKFGVESFL